MLQIVVDFIQEYGIWGLLASLAVEASSVPFPGGLVTLVFGYILQLSFIEVVLYGLLASAVYTGFSIIPYLIGYKLEEKLKEKTSRKKIEKAERWFKKCGIWSIAFSRPLGLGNYISYVSGTLKVNKWTFLSLTLLGILPWTIGVLWLGSVGHLKSVKSIMEEFQLYAILVLVVLTAIYIFYRLRKKKKGNKIPKDSKRSINDIRST
ncbi:VTT domain-containing protein [Virgibacillus necropolis]|uniref:DedA family protein n=1 Tax=Virgibacillus necropolis TaxID=163877 RepID=UPI00384EF921